jgi:ectoine hydroxylase-related dioxygenase (phytanoyl-CoA dioxygenase family)
MCDEDIREMEASLEELLNNAISMHFPSTHLPDLDSKWLFLKENNPSIKSRVYDLIKYFHSVNKFANSEKVEACVNQMLGINWLVDKAQLRLDDNQNERLLPLHQEAYGQINIESVNLWAPFLPTGPKSGGLAVIPGSHLMGELPHKFYPDMGNSHGVQESSVDTLKCQILDTKLGDAVIFHSLLIHGSTQNNTNKIRKTFVARYNGLNSIPYISDLDNPLYIPQK